MEYIFRVSICKKQKLIKEFAVKATTIDVAMAKIWDYDRDQKAVYDGIIIPKGCNVSAEPMFDDGDIEEMN